jgi:hypothetical protein
MTVTDEMELNVNAASTNDPEDLASLYVMNDCGASKSMTPDGTMIINGRKALKGKYAKTATGEKCEIPLVGEMNINGEVEPILVASHVPDLKFPLLSFHQATKQWKGYTLITLDAITYVKGKPTFPDSDIIMRKFQHEGLYWTPQNPQTYSPQQASYISEGEHGKDSETYGCSMGIEETSGELCEHPADGEADKKAPDRPVQRYRKVACVDLMRKYLNWLSVQHTRFAHKSGLRRTIKYQGVIGIPWDYGKLLLDHNFCVHCLQGKQCKCNHSAIKCRHREPGELFHTDMEYKPTMSWNKKQYSVVLVEHESQFCKMLFMHLKSKATDLIISALK